MHIIEGIMGNSLNLSEIDQEQAFNLTKFFIQSKQNIFLFGRRGVGKTEIAIQAVKECGFKINYINLSVIERADLAGYPDMLSSGDVISFKSPVFLPPLLNDKPDSVILFDEVDKSSPEITAPLLEILQSKKINGKPINVAGCILTGNLSNEGSYSNQISTALLDRGAKYVLSFNFEKWVDWAKSYQLHDVILGFLRSNPEFACGKTDDISCASPSPRGWTLASDALNKAREMKILDIETVTQVISGFVGKEAGLRFKIWYEHYRKFEPFVHSIIDLGHMTLDFNSLTPTEKVIFVITTCYYAKQKALFDAHKSKNKFIYLENLCKFLTNYKIEYELQVMGLYNSFDFDLITKYKLYSCKQFFDLFTRISEHITLKK
jgi:MoxR-like ATPase